MTPDLWLGFALAAFVIAIIPGPGVAAIMGFAFSSGRAVAIAAVLGMAVGNAVAISVSLAGAGAILASSALAFTILKWLGAAYLVTIGLLAIRRSRLAPPSTAATPPISSRTAFITTIAVGTFHPKTLIFFMAFATQFIAPGAPYLPQAAILVVTFTAIAAVTDLLYALAASRASRLLQAPRVRLWTQRAGGGALIAAGIATAAMRR